MVGSSSAGCMSRIDQSMLSEASRGGVPVFRRPSGRPIASSRSARRTDGLSPIRPPGRDTSPIWMTPRRNVPVVRTTADRGSRRRRPGTTPSIAVVRQKKIRDLALDHLELACASHRLMDRLLIQLAVRLRPRPAHRRALSAVQQAELDAGFVRRQAHDTTKRVDLPHEVALAEATDRRVAGHHADSRSTTASQGPSRASTRSGAGGLHPGMATADHDHVEALMFHVKHPYFPIQKDEKISPSMASTSMRPVNESSDRVALRISSAASSGVSPRSPEARAPSQATRPPTASLSDAANGLLFRPGPYAATGPPEPHRGAHRHRPRCVRKRRLPPSGVLFAEHHDIIRVQDVGLVTLAFGSDPDAKVRLSSALPRTFDPDPFDLVLGVPQPAVSSR
jgi:hypothetical protein